MPAPKNRRRVREGQPAVRLCRAEYGDRSENTKQTTRRIEHNRGSLNGEMFSGNKCALVEKHKIVVVYLGRKKGLGWTLCLGSASELTTRTSSRQSTKNSGSGQ